MFKHFLEGRWRVFGLIVCFYVALCFAILEIPDDKFHIYFLDVDQGDSMLVKTPENHQILIDGGPQNYVIEELAEVMPFFDKTIDMVVLTHPHADHVDGLIEVLKRYQVGSVVLTGVNYQSSHYAEFLNEIKHQQIQFFIAEKNMDFSFGAVVFDLIYPSKQILGDEFKNLNNSSIALRILYKNRIILLTGDLEAEPEKNLVKKGADLKADIFKASHHGSRNGSVLKFLEKIGPKIAIIQSGKNNKFGHPHKETLENFEKVGVKKIYRNDLNGRVDVEIE